jgi:hypothetical protein
MPLTRSTVKKINNILPNENIEGIQAILYDYRSISLEGAKKVLENSLNGNLEINVDNTSDSSDFELDFHSLNSGLSSTLIASPSTG